MLFLFPTNDIINNLIFFSGDMLSQVNMAAILGAIKNKQEWVVLHTSSVRTRTGCVSHDLVVGSLHLKSQST